LFLILFRICIIFYTSDTGWAVICRCPSAFSWIVCSRSE